jgi:hypothetical protein
MYRQAGPSHRDELLEGVLLDQVRRHKRSYRQAALFLAALLIALAGLATLVLPPTQAREPRGLAAFGLLVAVALAVPSFGDPRKAPGLVALRERAESVVWSYAIGGSKPYWIVLAMEDGTQVRLPAEPGRENEVLAAVSSLAPQAALGFSPEREMQFFRDPSRLRDAGREA